MCDGKEEGKEARGNEVCSDGGRKGEARERLGGWIGVAGLVVASTSYWDRLGKHQEGIGQRKKCSCNGERDGSIAGLSFNKALLK